jgi:hypothetical protein
VCDLPRLHFSHTKIICAGGDIYVAMASNLFSKPAHSVSEQDRATAKVICLGTVVDVNDFTDRNSFSCDMQVLIMEWDRP